MKCAYVADVHVANFPIKGGPVVAGINRRGRLVLDALEDAVQAAKEAQCDRFVVLGDLFDNTRPLPQLTAEVSRIFAEAEPMQVILLMGNHDRNSSVVSDHALGPLHWTSNVRVIERVTCIDDHIFLPFQSDRSQLHYFDTEVSGAANDFGVPLMTICAHVGLHDAAMRQRFAWAKDAADAMSVDDALAIMQANVIPWFFAGNWHSYKAWGDRGRMAVQVGSLCPTGWDNEGFDGYGHVVIGNGTVPDLIKIAGPRFITVRSQQEFDHAIIRNDELGSHACTLFVRWVAAPGELLSAKRILSEAKANKQIEDYDVQTDQKVTKVKALVAANAARSKTTLMDAASDYVTKIELPEGARRDRVWNHVKGFLRL